MHISSGYFSASISSTAEPSPTSTQDSFSDLGFENDPEVIEATAALARLETTPASELTEHDKVRNKL